jgi:hypothetical protein
MLRPVVDFSSLLSPSLEPERFVAAAVDSDVGSALVIVGSAFEEIDRAAEEVVSAIEEADCALAETTPSLPSSVGILIFFDASAVDEESQHASLSPQHQYSDVAVPSQGVNCALWSASVWSLVSPQFPSHPLQAPSLYSHKSQREREEEKTNIPHLYKYPNIPPNSHSRNKPDRNVSTCLFLPQARCSSLYSDKAHWAGTHQP